MWSSSFAGSICASRSAIGFAVGLGVGRDVAVGATDAVGVAAVGVAAVGVAAVAAALGVGECVMTRVGIASHDTSRTASSVARALIVLG